MYVNKITVVRDYADGIDDLLFSVENNGINEKQICIDGVGIRPIFEPRFFGKDHKDCEAFLTNRLKNSNGFDLAVLHLFAEENTLMLKEKNKIEI